MSVKLLKQNAVSNPNLLINGDFQIWQRGEAFSDKAQLINKYTADRWRVNHKNLTSSLRILKNSLSYGMYIDKKNTAGEVDICQILEGADLYLNKDLTVSINIVIAGKEITDTYTIKLTSSTTEQMKSNSQYYFGFRYTSSTNQLAIAFGIKAVVDCSINWIKLEMGEIPTKNVSGPYAEVLNMCERYYQAYSYLMLRNLTNSPGTLYGGFPFRCRLRNKPIYYSTIQTANGTDISTDLMDYYLNDNAVDYVQLKSYKLDCITIISLKLDAEIY